MFSKWFKNKEAEAEELWLTEQKKTKAEVFFEVHGETKTTGDFEAYLLGSGSFAFYMKASDVAQEHLARCYDRGFFKDTDGMTYPTCHIKKAWVATKPA